MTAGGQGGQQLGLGLGHTLATAESAQVGVANLRDHAHLGRAHLGQHGDLAAAVGAQLQHGIVVRRLDAQHAQGHAPPVIVISRAGRTLQAALQHGMDHLPRRGLAHAARHGDDDAGEVPPLPAGPLLQGPLRVVDIQDPAVFRNGFDSRNHGASGAAAKGLVDETGPVVVRSREGPEDIAGLHLAAVADHRTERSAGGILNPACGQDSAAGRLCQVVQGFHIFLHACAYSQSSAICRSSKAIRSSPTI